MKTLGNSMLHQDTEMFNRIQTELYGLSNASTRKPEPDRICSYYLDHLLSMILLLVIIQLFTIVDTI